MNDKVVFKLTKQGFFIVFDDTTKFSVLKELLKQKFEDSEEFFHGVKLKTILRGRYFEDDEFNEIKKIIMDITGFDDIKQEIPKFDWQANDIEGNTRFYRGTMRCGVSIDFNGNVVVLGDINPGAEVIATGNVIVTGTIKGMVHAGSKGNDTAIVCGKGINPTQLRIANLITVPPEEQIKKEPVFETAFIKDGNIYITEN